MSFLSKLFRRKSAPRSFTDQPVAAPRASRWSKVAAAHIASNPRCALCGGTTGLIVHHIQPFHLYPELELESTNLVTLCEGSTKSLNCHLWFGHLGNFQLWNPRVTKDIRDWRAKRAAALQTKRALRQPPALPKTESLPAA